MPPAQIALELSAVAKSAAAKAGFGLCGVAAITDKDFAELTHFPVWIEAGHAGEMEYLKARDDSGELKRASPRRTVPWARSVIVCGLNYESDHPYSTEVTHHKDRGWIARYAWSREDYHQVVLRKLRLVEEQFRSAASNSFAGNEQDLITRCYVDTGPHIERVYAKYAGIGWIGKNTCIINQQVGSWIFLGVILTSVELPADVPAADRCGTCQRCIEACPTQAITEPYKLNATRCISYLTIEKKGAIPEQLRSGMGNHIFGCDICQDVCPWNRTTNEAHPHLGATTELAARPELVNPALDWLAQMSSEDYQKIFRGSPVKRAQYSGLRRNVAVAMGNSGETRFSAQLNTLAQDEDAVVAEHARWALERLDHRQD